MKQSTITHLVILALALAACSKDPASPDNPNPTPKGAISITSSTPGAAIALDGAATGLVTPDTLAGLEVGDHRVGATLAGYYVPSEQVVRVVQDSVVYVHFALKQIPITGAIGVSSSVSGAAISIDDVPTGLVTPDTLLGVAAGVHAVGIFLQGYSTPEDQSVSVSANSLTHVHFDLLRLQGAIAVTSSPIGARILLDGADTGQITPDTLRSVPDGLHRVGVLMDGFYPPTEQELLVPPGGVADANFNLEPIPGRIAVTSTEPGATIALDASITGLVTPDTLTNVSIGSHQVGVFLPGYYRPDDQTVEVAPGTATTIHFVLFPIASSGGITVDAPYPASIILDGFPTGLVTPDTLVGLSPGEHTVSIELGGFQSDPRERLVTVVPGEAITANFNLLVSKFVVCEDFSNYACVPCPPADAALQQAIDEVGRARVVSVNPHVNFPGPGDPFYQFNLNANNARIFFNQVGVAPTILVDGTRVPQTEIESPAMVRARIETALAQPAPVAIGVRSRLTATTFEVAADVWGVGSSIPSDLLLFVWVVEGEAILDPPGPNGQSNHTNVLRQLFPVPAAGTTGGEALGTLAPGDHRHFDYVYDLPAGIDPAELRAVAFAQRSPQRTVVQAGVSF